MTESAASEEKTTGSDSRSREVAGPTADAPLVDSDERSDPRPPPYRVARRPDRVQRILTVVALLLIVCALVMLVVAVATKDSSAHPDLRRVDRHPSFTMTFIDAEQAADEEIASDDEDQEVRQSARSLPIVT